MKSYVAVQSDTLADQLRFWWDIESYASRCDTNGKSKDERKALETLKNTINFKEGRYEIDLLWSDEFKGMPNKYISAAAQLRSLEKRLEKDEDIRKRYQETIDVDLGKSFVRKYDKFELEQIRKKQQWYLPHPLVINPNKPENNCGFCNAKSKFRAVSSNHMLNDIHLSGLYLLQNLIEKKFSIQRAFNSDDSGC